MSEVYHLSAIPAYEGPHAIEGVRFRPARAVLGVTSWGMNVLELDPECSGHPAHDHAHDGQEEVYVVLEGQAELHVDGEVLVLKQGDLVRVPPEAQRQLVTGVLGVKVLALGGTPGQAYQATPGM